MQRVNVYDEQGQLGWFYPDKAEQFEEQTYWDGKTNHISVATGSQWNHEALYRTPEGRWVLRAWSDWQGGRETWTFVGDTAARTWLLRNDEDDAVERIFGELAGECGPGGDGDRPYLVQSRDADGLWQRVDGEAFARLTDALERRDVLTDRVPDGQSWKAFRVVDRDGAVLDYREQDVPPAG